MALSALVCAGLLILWTGRDTLFRQDEWVLIITRRGSGLDAYLTPFNEHLLLFPVVVFKGLLAVVGLGHYWPYRLAVVIVHLVCVTLLFVVVERRRGALVAVLVATPILVLGSSSEVLLFPIDMGFAGSLAAGLGTMLALDARSRRGDVLACVLLVFALASSGLGISIALGVFAELVAGRDRWRRFWIVAIPVALYGIWYLAYNAHPHRQGPLEYAHAPAFAVRTAGAAVAGLLGIPEFETAGTRLAAWPARVGILLAILGVLALAWLLVARGRLTPRLAMLIVTLGSYWAFIGVSRAYTNGPGAPRYIYTGAVLILLIGVEATRGLAIPSAAAAALATLALASAALNLHWLLWNGDLYRRDSDVVAAELGALTIARDRVPTDFRPILEPTYPFRAGEYFQATRGLDGTAAASPAELASLPERARAAADAELVRGTIAWGPFTGRERRFLRAAGHDPLEDGCTGVERRTSVAVPAAGLVVLPGAAPVVTSLRRFASGFSGPGTGLPAADGPRLLVAPPDHARVPWRARLSASAPFRVC